MADEDAMVDAMLEGTYVEKDENAPYGTSADSKNDVKKSDRDSKRSKSRSRSSSRKRSKRSSSRDRKRSSSRDRRRRRSRSRDKKRSRSRDRRRSSRERRRSRSRSRDRRRRSRSPRRRSRSRDRPRIIDHRDRDRRSPPRRLPGPERRDVMPFTARTSPPKNAKMDLSSEERDHRTIFILQLGRNTRPRDLEEFFSSVGAVRDVRIITDSRTGRSKGIAYVEFWEEESVNLGLALNGQKLIGAPLIIQRTCAERNRAASAAATVGSALGFGPAPNQGPCKLRVGSLHPNIDEKMLTSVFDAFGRILEVKIMRDSYGSSQGIGYVSFSRAEDAHKASDQLNGFEIAGSCIKTSVLEEDSGPKQADNNEPQRNLDDMGDRQGISLGQGGRVQLMAKLAQSQGVELPAPVQQEPRDPSIPSIATQCFMLSNMFDPTKETDPNWSEDVRQDVLEECTQNGGAVHIYVDPTSQQGNVYVKCPSVSAAHKSVTALHGRWFSGKVITANYVPVQSYHDLFPESVQLTVPLQPRSASGQMMPPLPGYGMPPAGFPGPPMGMPNGFTGYY